jgi:hypothetical protein
MPHIETQPIPKNIPSCRGNIWGRTNGRPVGKSGTPGVEVNGGLLGQITTTKPKLPETPYMISSTGPYNSEEKIILKVTIRGHDNNEHHTTAMVDCRATEKFIDGRYGKQNNIPLRQKAIPRRVLAVDGWEVANEPVTHDALVDLMINNHYETIRLHCITIDNSPIIVGLPWLRKHNTNIDWKEGWVTFDSARYAKECLVTSPHAITVAEEKAIGEYYQDTAQDMAFQDIVCSTSMLEQEEDEEREERGIEEAITQGYIEETLTTWELCYVGLETTQRQEGKPTSGPLRVLSGATVGASGTPGGFNLQNNSNQSYPPALTGDVVPGEYHEYLHIFEEREDQGLPPHRYHDHHIPLLEGKTPPFEPIRALDENRLRALREYLETNLRQGWIRESTSPAGAPIHFVQKKDGSLRLRVDYRGLNAITVKDRTPLPLIGEALDRLANAKIYTKLDVKDAYHNLWIAVGDEWKMAFRTKYGLYEYLVMPFGLTNARASFQRWMNEVLSDYLDVFCIAYLDNILIYSDNLEQHRQHVKMIVRRVE